MRGGSFGGTSGLALIPLLTLKVGKTHISGLSPAMNERYES
jgi:hypothetical protein